MLWPILFLFWISRTLGNSLEAIKLTELAQRHDDFIIRITDGDLSMFTGVRDYFTVVVITSSAEKHGCPMCQKLPPVIEMVSKSWARDYSFTHSLFFVEIDLAHSDNLKIAQLIGLETIPHIWVVPQNLQEQYEPYALVKEKHFIFHLPKTSAVNQAFELAQMLSVTLNRSIYLRTQEPVTQFITYFGLTFGLIMLIRKKGPKIITNLGKSFAYMILSLGAIMVSITGYHFTKIQKAPFLARNEKGIMFISGGKHYQFGTEIIILSVTYSLLGTCFISLLYLGRYKSTAVSLFKSSQVTMLIILNSIILYFLNSVLTSIAVRKDLEYPYHYVKLF